MQTQQNTNKKASNWKMQPTGVKLKNFSETMYILVYIGLALWVCVLLGGLLTYDSRGLPSFLTIIGTIVGVVFLNQLSLYLFSGIGELIENSRIFVDYLKGDREE